MADKGYIIPVAAILMSLSCHQIKEPGSRVNIADVADSNQLLSGFWQIESNSWRWTARAFAVSMRPPDGAETSGATLYLHLFIPDSQIELLGPMTLSASTDNYSLASETFSKGGTYIFARQIPKELMATSLLPVRFSFDKALSPAKADGRELAAIVTGIELQAN
jgi:hypothetical protein